MRVKPPRVPRAAQLAGSATQGPRVVPGTYTVRLTRGTEVTDTKLAIALDRRAKYSLADRRAQFEAMMSAHKLFEDMSKVTDQIEATRAAIADRIKALGADPLATQLQAVDAKLEAAKKLVVATTEGGAITGEERIREHLDTVYGALGSYEGKPAKYQVERVATLRRELTDVSKMLADIIATDARALDKQLENKRLKPIPALSELAPRPSLDRLAIECVESRGEDCGGSGDRVANERD
jgi:hypothetical protein